MKIGIVGSWHLGSVYSNVIAAKGFKTTVYDPDSITIAKLKDGIPPIFEPELENLLQENISKNLIEFTTNPKDLCHHDILWACFDTKINDHDEIDIQNFFESIKPVWTTYQGSGNFIISSQVPVGTSRLLSQKMKDQGIRLEIAYSPENLRLGSSLSYLQNPDRMIIGIENENQKNSLSKIFDTISHKNIWMKLESAEMTKHAINSFLALEITFANELGILSQHIGANIDEVSTGLKSDDRIGPKAYLKAGYPFAGGTLARDLSILKEKFEEANINSSLIHTSLKSNVDQKIQIVNFIENILPQKNQKISIVGLVYKSGTNTLRRSLGIDIGNSLHQKGYEVFGYDDAIENKTDLSPIIYAETNTHSDLYLILNKSKNFENVISSIPKNCTIIDLANLYENEFKNFKSNHITLKKGNYVTK